MNLKEIWGPYCLREYFTTVWKFEIYKDLENYSSVTGGQKLFLSYKSF